jgi:hypothetical protein
MLAASLSADDPKRSLLEPHLPSPGARYSVQRGSIIVVQAIKFACGTTSRLYNCSERIRLLEDAPGVAMLREAAPSDTCGSGRRRVVPRQIFAFTLRSRAFIQIIGSNAIDRRPKGLVTTSHRGSSMRDPRELAPAPGNVGAPNERQRCRVAMVCAKASNCDGHHRNTPDKAVAF